MTGVRQDRGLRFSSSLLQSMERRLALIPVLLIFFFSASLWAGIGGSDLRKSHGCERRGRAECRQ
jgi:hypothetical protein